MLIIYHRTRISDTVPLSEYIDALGRYGSVHLETACDGDALEVLPGLLDRIGPGDCVVVWSFERLGRNLGQVITALHEIFSAGASLFTVCPEHRGFIGHNGRTTPIELVDHLHAAHVCFRQDAARRGVLHARRTGHQLGRPQKMSDEDVACAERMRARGMTMEAIAAHFGVHRETIRRRLAAEDGRAAC